MEQRFEAGVAAEAVEGGGTRTRRRTGSRAARGALVPPPRPSPDSFLTITKPIDEDAEFNVDPSFSILANSHVRVAFSASPRRVEVTDAGQMKWESRRAYTGRWYVGRSPE